MTFNLGVKLSSDSWEFIARTILYEKIMVSKWLSNREVLTILWSYSW